jgi:UDPglucose--hexose-1-phosphate uridylyltransferase
MAESSLRFDVTTGDWIVFSPERTARPNESAARTESPRSSAEESRCAFCPGNEAETLPAIDVQPDPQSPERWIVRVFANKYPALSPEAPRSCDRTVPLFRQRGGRGVHEVVVCSPDHFAPIARLPEPQLTALLRVLQRRYRVLESNPELEVVQIFGNYGAHAGASLPHPHLQIIAAPVVPRRIRVKYQAAAEYYHAQGVSLYQDLCQAELDAKARIIIDSPEFIAFAPFASRVPYEAWIMPRDPKPSFGLADPAGLPSLARTLRELLQRLQLTLGDPAYNLTFFSAPRRHADEPDFVWHIEILPRLEIDAGFELATGMAINGVLPEAAAEALRRAAIPAVDALG